MPGPRDAAVYAVPGVALPGAATLSVRACVLAQIHAAQPARALAADT